MEEKLVALDLEYPVGVTGSLEDTKVSTSVVTTAIKAFSEIVASVTNAGKQK